jgi:prepilin-type N-terminal cleavage/methylation domain-containing protein
MRQKKGFSLLELLIVIAVMGLLLISSAGPISGLRASIEIEGWLTQAVSLLRYCRQLALSESAAVQISFSQPELCCVLKKEGQEGTVFKRLQIPPGLTLQAEGLLGFNSRGHPTYSRTMIFKDAGQKEYKIALSVGTGRVRRY